MNERAEDQTPYFRQALLCGVRLVLAALDRGVRRSPDNRLWRARNSAPRTSNQHCMSNLHRRECGVCFMCHGGITASWGCALKMGRHRVDIMETPYV